jgi:hypothetical protein
VQDARKGDVKIVGLSDAPIAWPIGLKHTSRSPVLYGGLIKAVRKESKQAVGKARGVSGQTVIACPIASTDADGRTPSLIP